MYGQQKFGMSFQVTPVVKKLLIANVAVFLVTALFPAAFGYLAFRPDAVLSQFWGAFTYMFVHADGWHLFGNMLVLFFFGPPLESRWGGGEFFRFYTVAGLGGVALSFVFSPAAPVVGASAACFGVMLAFAMNWPKSPIYIFGIYPIQARVLVGIFVFFDLLNGVSGANTGVAHFAHLGGFLTAFLYLKADWRPARFAGKVKEKTRRRPRKLAVVPREERKASAESMAEPEERKMLDEVDRVLDKISAQGISSLTEEERKLLDEVSRRRRTN